MTQNTILALREIIDHRRTARALILKGADLRGACLVLLRADDIDFEEADLRESRLAQVHWKGCILRDARLDAADLTDGVLRLCDFDQARLTNATLVRARFENSTARGARFDGADLTGAVLTDTDFSRASLRGANLAGASASGADFRGADFRGARLRSAVLVDSDLRGADLTDADLQDADLRGADLRGVVEGNLALAKDGSGRGALPFEMANLSEMMTPIVFEVLRTAGRRGAIDPQTVQSLIEKAARHPGTSPRNAPSPETLAAVSQALDDLGDNVLPALLGALQQPNQGEPPPEVQAMILRLREKLALDETATAEDVLSRLISGLGRSSH